MPRPRWRQGSRGVRPFSRREGDERRDRQSGTPERRDCRVTKLVLSRHAHPAARAAGGHVRGLCVLPRGRRHRRWQRCKIGAHRQARSLAGGYRAPLCRTADDRAYQGARRAGADLRSEGGGLPRNHRRHGDGRGARHPRAELGGVRSLLRPSGFGGRTPLGQNFWVGGPQGPGAVASPRPRLCR